MERSTLQGRKKSMKLINRWVTEYPPRIIQLIAPLVLFNNILFDSKALFWGTPVLQFNPWWYFAWESIFSGKLPLWNPYLGMGAPYVANYQSALFYPPYWTTGLGYLISGETGIAQTFDWLVTFHVVFAGIGMIQFLKKLGVTNFGQVMGGLAFSMSGYLVAKSGFISMNAAIAWVPWVILAFHEISHKPGNSKSVLRLGITSGLMLLSGHAQVTWYCLLLGVMLGTYWNVHNRESFTQSPIKSVSKLFNKPVIGFLLTAGLALLLGFFIASIQLLPTAEYLLQSQRASEVEFIYAMNYSFWPWRLLGFIVPGFFGSPVHGDFWGYATYWEDALYIGIIPIVLAITFTIISFYKQINKKDNHLRNDDYSLVLVLFGISVLSFILAFGKNTAIFPWLYEHIPTFNLFQAPARYLLWAEFSIIVIAALAVRYWNKPTGRLLYWSRLGVMGAFAVTVGGVLASVVLNNVKPSFIHATLLAGILTVGAGIMNLTIPASDEYGSKKRIWEWIALSFIAIDLVFIGYGINPAVELDLYREPSKTLESIAPIIGDGRLYIPKSAENSLKYDRFFTFEDYEISDSWHKLRDVFLPNTNIWERIPVVNNYDPFTPGRFAFLFRELETLPAQVKGNLMKLMNVAVIENVSPSTEYGVEFHPIEGRKRVWWFSCIQYASSPENAWDILTDRDFNYQHIAVIEENIALGNGECGSSHGIAQVVSSTISQMIVEVSSDTDGLVMLSDTYYPGWTAEVNGKQAEIKIVDYIFRGVQVPAGDSTITFTYRPIAFYAGLFVTVFTISGLIVWGINQKDEQSI